MVGAGRIRLVRLRGALRAEDLLPGRQKRTTTSSTLACENSFAIACALNGDVSASVNSTTSRRSALPKKFRVGTAASAPNRVARTFPASDEAGRSTPSASWSVELNESRLAVGKSSGSVRSVIDAIPTGTVDSSSRIRSAAERARSKRASPPASSDASIEREVSRTKNASASDRAACSCVSSSTG